MVYAWRLRRTSKSWFDMEIPAYIRKLTGSALVLASIATSCALMKGKDVAAANIPAPDPAVTSRVFSATDDFGFRLLNALAKDPALASVLTEGANSDSKALRSA